MQLQGASKPSPKLDGWICESQVSGLVSAVDTHGWTGYVFEDTYYKAWDSSKDSNMFYSKPGFYFPDALTAGALDSTRFLEPRQYFLKVFQIRIDQAFREWRALVDVLEQTMKQ